MSQCKNTLVLSTRVVAVFCALATSSTAQTDQDKVERYLARLGIPELHAVQLERMIFSDLAQARQAALGKKLAGLYADLLLKTADKDKKQEHQRILARIDKLVGRVPSANTPALRVMKLNSQYLLAEKLTLQWLDSPKDAAARDEAEKILAETADQFRRYATELNTAAEKMAEVVDGLEDEQLLAVKEKELQRLAAVAAQATFFSGWSNYYYGVIRGGGAATSKLFMTARKSFHELLGVGPADKYADFDAADLGLDSVARAMAMIGLGMTEIALGNLAEGKQCFEVVSGNEVSESIRDRGTYLHMRALLTAGRYRDAQQLAQERLHQARGQYSVGVVSMCYSLARTALAQNDAAARSAGLAGLAGLAQHGQVKLIRELLDQFKVTIDNDAGFYLLAIYAQDQFARADKLKSKSDRAKAIAAAAETYRTALAKPEAKRSPETAGRCYYGLAWCYRRMNNLPDAADAFEMAARRLKGLPGDEIKKLAAEAAWAACTTYLELSGQPEFSQRAATALREFKQDFPDHPQAKRVGFLIAKLSESERSSADLIRQFSGVKPDAPDYRDARYRLCGLWHSTWKKDRNATNATEVVSAVDEFLEVATQDVRKLRAVLYAVEVGMGAKSPNIKLAGTYLGKARAIAENLPATEPLVQDFHYRALQWSQAANNRDQQQKHSQWLAEKAPQSRYAVVALVLVAQRADKAVAAAKSKQDRLAAVGQAANVYGNLTRKLGEPGSSKNATVAYSRLAGYEMELGKYTDAARHYEQLLRTRPKDKNYLRRAARAHHGAKKFGASLEHWRRLLVGLPKGSEEWFEAKYYQMDCLAHTDPSSARKVFKQFSLMHPDHGPVAWKDKFQQLGKRL